MNELKATPGEWFTKREGWSTVYVEARIGGGLIQEVAACGPTEAGPEQQEANASLIAAAWDMYHEIRYHLEMTRLMPDGEQTDDFKRMDALLKKARGEA